MPPYLSLVLPSISIIISGLEVSHGISFHFTDEQTEAQKGWIHLNTLSEIQNGTKMGRAAWPLAALSLCQLSGNLFTLCSLVSAHLNLQ